MSIKKPLKKLEVDILFNLKTVAFLRSSYLISQH